jgi:cell division septation protein DedD
MADDGFHEIQLSGKQLVFLFMATTIVAVVIFLCGVMVGRGVRAQKAAAAGTESAPFPTADLSTQPAATPPTTPPATGGAAQPPAAGGDPSLYNRLSKDTPPETLKPPTETPPVTAEPKAAPATPPSPPARNDAGRPVAKKTPPADPASGKRAAPATTAPPTGWIQVQVAATRDRAEADAIVARLKAKEFPAYVTVAPGAATMFRVRVGNFETRAEAEEMKRRLEKEGWSNLWISR